MEVYKFAFLQSLTLKWSCVLEETSSFWQQMNTDHYFWALRRLQRQSFLKGKHIRELIKDILKERKYIFYYLTGSSSCWKTDFHRLESQDNASLITSTERKEAWNPKLNLHLSLSVSLMLFLGSRLMLQNLDHMFRWLIVHMYITCP